MLHLALINPVLYYEQFSNFCNLRRDEGSSLNKVKQILVLHGGFWAEVLLSGSPLLIGKIPKHRDCIAILGASLEARRIRTAGLGETET